MSVKTFTPTWEIWNCWSWDPAGPPQFVNGMLHVEIDPAPLDETQYKLDFRVGGQRVNYMPHEVITISPSSPRIGIQLQGVPLGKEVSLVITEDEKVVITPKRGGSQVVVTVATQWPILHTFTLDDCSSPTQS
jgi:hypothetical protein